MTDTPAMSPSKLCDLQTSNIITGKRKRRSTTRLVDSEEWQSSYSKIMLEDVPDNEVFAALQDECLDSDDEQYSDDEISLSESEEDNDFIVNDAETEDDDFSADEDSREESSDDDDLATEDEDELKV